MIQVSQDHIQVDDHLIIVHPLEEYGDLDGLLGILAQMVIRIAKEQSCISPTDQSAV
ncbi:MAG: hypothetical protein M3R24_27070 [Chloroflexota bacterium]|nr:hypothetical protein [Chloroflexota bacterium]